MKKSYLFGLFAMASFVGHSQVGIGTTSPNNSASLDIQSSNSGILIPRMTQANRLAISSPAEGLLVYQTNATEGFWFHNGSVWAPVSEPDNDWTIDGNDIYNSNTGNVGIGETSPGIKLHVSNNTDGEGVMTLENDAAGGFAGLYLQQNGNYRGHVGYVNPGGSGVFDAAGFYQLASGDRDMLFSTTNDGSELFFERMRITRAGNINIQTSNGTNTIWIDNEGGSPTIGPDADNIGYLGTAAYSWFRSYVGDAYLRPPVILDTYDDLALLNNIKFDTYWSKDLQHHVGKMRPESIPKEITNYGEKGYDPDNIFVSSAKLNGLLIGAARQLDFESKLRDQRIVEKLQQLIEKSPAKMAVINDFGSVETTNNKTITVHYSNKFKKQLAGRKVAIMITPTANYIKYYISSKDENGFILEVETDEASFAFDWSASFKTKVTATNSQLEKDVFASTGFGKVDKNKSYPTLANEAKSKKTKKEGL